MAVSPKDYRAAMTADKKGVAVPTGSQIDYKKKFLDKVQNVASNISTSRLLNALPIANLIVPPAAANVNSTANIARGKGGVLDYLTLGTSLLPPVAGGAVKGVRVADKLATKAAVKKILKDPDISIVAPRDVMPNVLSSRFKSQRELLDEMGNKQAVGRREIVERDLLGYPLGTPSNQRPIYGAVANKTDLPQWMLQRTPGQLGDALRLFDPRTNRSGVFGNYHSAINRVPASKVEGSFTIGDSWSPFLNNYPAPNKLGNLANLQDPENVNNILEALAKVRAAKGRHPAGDPGVNGKLPYIEAQMAATKNPVDSIRRIDFPPSSREVWQLAKDRLPRTVEKFDPVLKGVPSATKEIAKQPHTYTRQLLEEILNNPTRPQIPQKMLKDLILTDQIQLRSLKGKAFI